MDILKKGNSAKKEIALDCALEFFNIIHNVYRVPTLNQKIEEKNYRDRLASIKQRYGIKRALSKIFDQEIDFYSNVIFNEGTSAETEVFKREFEKLAKKYGENNEFIKNIRRSTIEEKRTGYTRIHIKNTDEYLDRLYPECPICSHRFFRPPWDRRTIYCERKCKSAAYIKRIKEGKLRQRRCPICHEPLTNKRSDAKTCSRPACQKALQRKKIKGKSISS